MLVKIDIHLLINIEMITININNEFIASLHCTDNRKSTHTTFPIIIKVSAVCLTRVTEKYTLQSGP